MVMLTVEIKGQLTRRFGLPLVFCIVIASIALIMPGCCATTPGIQSKGPVSPEEFVKLEENWGIQVVSIRQSAAGHILDFRFRVIDPDKASLLLRRQEKAFLIDQATGMKLPVPSIGKVGSLRQTTIKPEAGTTYFILFANGSGLVKPGGRVTLVIGDFRLENLTVE